jgi:acetylornithine deacetylase
MNGVRATPVAPVIDGDYMKRMLEQLVAIPSVNPAFDATSGGEAEIAVFGERELAQLGLATTVLEPQPNRVSVVGRLPGAGGGSSLMLYAHYDTVAPGGMHDPFTPRVAGDRLYGRGAYDMKAGLAACLAAVKALRDARTVLAGDVIVAAVADEEVASLGIQDVLRHVRTDAAIVTEPTELALCLAHKGFAWIEVTTHGRGAHGSRFEDGIDANMRMGRVLARLEALEREVRSRPAHELVGPPSLHAAVLSGGSGASTYAATCRLEIERRTIPGETPAGALREIQDVVDILAREDGTFRASVRPLLARESFEAERDGAIVRSVERQAQAVLSRRPVVSGASYWMDAAFLAAAGIDTVVIGPCGGGAHADIEWVECSSAADVALILARTAADYCV